MRWNWKTCSAKELQLHRQFKGDNTASSQQCAKLKHDTCRLLWVPVTWRCVGACVIGYQRRPFREALRKLGAIQRGIGPSFELRQGEAQIGWFQLAFKVLKEMYADVRKFIFKQRIFEGVEGDMEISDVF